MLSGYHQYFKAFASISKAIHSGRDTHEILTQIVTSISGIMEARGSIYWIVNKDLGQIEHKVSCGFDYTSLSTVDFKILETLFKPDSDQMTFIDDARYDPRIPNLDRLGKKRIKSVIGMPFKIVEPWVGILAVYFEKKRQFVSGEKTFLHALGEQGAIALHKALAYDEKMLATFKQTIAGLVLALEAKDSETHGHSVRVARYAKLTAAALGLSERKAEDIYHAGLLHDIGKIGMSDKIMMRLGRVSGEEMDIVRRHSVAGAKILEPLTFLSSIVPMVLHHHERFDGSGWPHGLKGDHIPIGARILSVCDAFETMISGRALMDKIDLFDAAIQLREGCNTVFDPKAVKALVHVIKTTPRKLDLPPGSDPYIQKLEQLFAGADEMATPFCFTLGF